MFKILNFSNPALYSHHYGNDDVIIPVNLFSGGISRLIVVSRKIYCFIFKKSIPSSPKGFFISQTNHSLVVWKSLKIQIAGFRKSFQISVERNSKILPGKSFFFVNNKPKNKILKEKNY